ncbi:4-carboxymuconolactone decarboxylase [Streptomyces sp. BK208]|uniref:carboxymuconolactone decarboxylase family protein n=1 Tax=Streptomyces sp. BK208 TaxID=2512150 RepID=UPI00105FF820|nr:carboxymuconolactone decarboxylase family protein [Streptomyces sp. BK208]TDT31628.1 4-carboxymuconolactone decarboxylase [Streptomyces sp. BK208]
MHVLDQVDGEAGRRVVEALQDTSPELVYQGIAWGFGEIYARSELTLRERELVTLGALAAMGGCESQVEVHVHAALNVGLSPEEVTEALLQIFVHCGMARAINATLVAKKVFSERGIKLPAPRSTDSTTPRT